MLETKMEFSGLLASIPASDLFQWAKNDRRTGDLVVRRSSREKRLSFRDGTLVGATSDDPAEFFGQYLLLNGYLSEGDLVGALAFCAENGKRLGSALVELEVLPREKVARALHDHIQDLTLDLFLWDRGVFFFESGEPETEEIAAEPIDSFFVAMEGTRWLDEYRRIRRVLTHDEIILRRSRKGDELPGLSPLSRRIHQLVDGERTLGQVHRALGGSLFRFLAAVLDLCVKEVLDIASTRTASASATRELSLHDLMLAQAGVRAHDGSRGTASHEGVPFALLEKMVPIWLGEPIPPNQKDSFYLRCDGSTRLRDLLTSRRKDELDLLFTALGRGVLALLPAPIAELESTADRRRTPEGRRWWRRIVPGLGEGPKGD
ncbi:MAG TPA: DUF4388 domain-containing protein [Thermoanaerobaculia bacterium]|nr:DUF4388 domain-containing protein [Thermoanaerobaculia bacterium]